MRYEVRLVWAATTAVAVALAASLLNRRFKLGILSRLAEQVVIVLIPPLALIFLVLGTIFLGIATPTEGGAMGATGALLLALLKGRISMSVLKQALDSTTKLTAFVMFILIGARVFGLTFYGLNGNKWIEELLLALPGGEYGFLIVVTIIVFILGCFLDFFEIAFILVPLLAPVAEKLGIDLIWFGIILGINLQTSFLTPPFGFALFYLRSIAPRGEWVDKVTNRTMPGILTTDIYKGAVPYIIIQFLVILLIIAFPRLVTHYKDDVKTVDPSTIKIEIPSFNTAPKTPGKDGQTSPGGLPGLQLPSLGGPNLGQPPKTDGGLQLPTLQLPGAPKPAPAPAAPAAKPEQPSGMQMPSGPPKFN